MQAKLPDRLTNFVKALPDNAHGTWAGTLLRTGKGAPRVRIEDGNYDLVAADDAPEALKADLGRIGKGEMTGSCKVTGTVRLEKRRARLVVEEVVVDR